MRLCLALLLLAVPACRPAAPPAPHIAAAIPDPADPCHATCTARYPSPPDPGAYVSYCDELCTTATAAAPQCVDGCRRANGPGAYYDDDGEYQEHSDDRTDDQRAAADEACAQECAAIPAISAPSLTACVDACVGDGGNDVRCAITCDPDPYDECRYTPCD